MSRFARISNQRICQQIVDQIAGMVRAGVLRPGDRLPAERQLAEEFGVSRAAVREAMSAMFLAGSLEVRPGEGTYIRSVSAERLVTPPALLPTIERDDALSRELLEVRRAMEAETAFLAALRREPDDLDAMAAALHDAETADGLVAADADWRFHYAIATAAGNGLMFQLMRTVGENTRALIRTCRERLLRIPGMDQVLREGHQAILTAIRERQPELARDRMRTHLHSVERALYAHVPPSPAAGEGSRHGRR